MSSPSLTPDEIRAAAETHHELGPDYQPAVIESFLDKVGREIDARVDARLAGHHAGQPGQPGPLGQPFPQPYAAPSAQVRPARDGKPFALAIVSMALGIPLSAIAVAAGSRPVGGEGLVIIWIAIAVINVAYSLGMRPPSGRR
ncbi:MAG TPA: hypothetical protein VF834_17460 [Streptosporangiaceae bacterium]